MRRLLLSAAVGLVFAAGASAQTINYTGGTYNETFDSLGTTSSTVSANGGIPGLNGWYGRGSTSSGNTSFSYGTDTGTSNTARIYAYRPNTTSSEKALGSLTTLNPVGASQQFLTFGARITNSTLDTTFDTISVGYRGELWHAGSAGTDSLLFSYKIFDVPNGDVGNMGNDSYSGGIQQDATWQRVSSLDFSMTTTGAGGARDGNSTGNFFVFNPVQIALNTTLKPGQELWLRWFDVRSTANDHGLAIDDLTFSASALNNAAVPVPPALAVLGLGSAIGYLQFVRRRRTAA